MIQILLYCFASLWAYFSIFLYFSFPVNLFISFLIWFLYITFVCFLNPSKMRFRRYLESWHMIWFFPSRVRRQKKNQNPSQSLCVQQGWVFLLNAQASISLRRSLYRIVTAFSSQSCAMFLQVVWNLLTDVRFAQWVVSINVSLIKPHPGEIPGRHVDSTRLSSCWRFPGLNPYSQELIQFLFCQRV